MIAPCSISQVLAADSGGNPSVAVHGLYAMQAVNALRSQHLLIEQMFRALQSCGQGAKEDGGQQWHDEKLVDAAYAAAEAYLKSPEALAPIDMVLHCPECGLQHIDGPDNMHVWDGRDQSGRNHVSDEGPGAWSNPPHRSHLCRGCGHTWRPADVPTNGVAAVKTSGKADSPIASQGQARAATIPNAALADLHEGLAAKLHDGPARNLHLETAAALRAPAAGAVVGPVGNIDAIALARYKVVPSHDSMFHRFAVVAGDGKQQLYLGRETECQNMASKFAGAFLDGAFYQSQLAAAQPAPSAQRDAALEAVRKRLCELPRSSFTTGPGGGIRRAADRTGSWIDFDAAHALFDPVAADAALARKDGPQ